MMGKPTGFMEFERLNKDEIKVEERIKNFNDFHISFDLNIQRQQASRCMNCGVPFCQSAIELKDAEPNNIVVFNQGDIGEYLRVEDEN